MKWLIVFGILIGFSILYLSASEKTYDDKVALAWNSFANESKLWTTIVNNQTTVKKRGQFEKEEFARLKAKWALVVMEVENIE